MSSIVHASTSITLRAYRQEARVTLMPSQKVQVTLPLSFCHVLKCPKVIESNIPWRTSVVAYLFHALKIQMTRCNGQWKVEGTVAKISNTCAKSLSTRELCDNCARKIL